MPSGKLPKAMTEDQDNLYSFLCQDAYTTTAEIDMPETCKAIYDAVIKQTDRQCIIELERELMSESEYEEIEDEAFDTAVASRYTTDENEFEQSAIFYAGELLYAKAMRERKEQ